MSKDEAHLISAASKERAGHTDQSVALKRRTLLKGGAALSIGAFLRISGTVPLARAMVLAGGATATANAAAARVFKHPGLLHTDADFLRMRVKVNAGEQAWLDGWNRLISDGYSQLDSSPRPLVTINRASGNNNTPQLYIDIHRAYQLAIRWQVSQDTLYADHAVRFLNAWSSTLTSIEGNADRYLAAGIYGYQFANVAEIMRTYKGWARTDLERFQYMMLNVFYPLSSRFLKEHNDAEITNYWANWDQCALACVLGVGVLCDREDIYNEALDYYKFGGGMGAALNAVYYVHPGNLGQWQESSRDAGHCTLGISLAAAFCEMAWQQGDDMYGYDNCRFLAGAEYVAKSNLRNSSGAFYQMPWFPYHNRHGLFDGVSPAGLGSMRPTWECVYNHYAMRKGIAAPYVSKQVAQMYPEGNDRTGDQLGFGTLLFSRSLEATELRPYGVTARLRGNRVVASWWGVVRAESYTVERATDADGPFSIVASGITDTLTYTDSNLGDVASYYYRVKALVGGTQASASDAVEVAIKPKIVYGLAFDEGGGSSVSDSAGGAESILEGGEWVPGVAGWAVALDGIGGHVVLPEQAIAGLGDFTIETFFYADSLPAWARLFDFGSGSRRWMMLTLSASDGKPSFQMTTTHGYATQSVSSRAPFIVGRWVHVAVTLSDSICTLYFDGTVVGSNEYFTLVPADLGPATHSYLGRSQYTQDAFTHGRYDRFRIWSGALTAEQIYESSKT